MPNRSVFRAIAMLAVAQVIVSWMLTWWLGSRLPTEALAAVGTTLLVLCAGWAGFLAARSGASAVLGGALVAVLDMLWSALQMGMAPSLFWTAAAVQVVVGVAAAALGGWFGRGPRVYQPDRGDLLINTSWGVPKNQVAASTAEAQHLVLFHERWVTEQQLHELKRQNAAYRWLRASGMVLMVLGSVHALAFIFSAGQRDAWYTLVLEASVAAWALGAGVGLYRFRPWTPDAVRALVYCCIIGSVGVLLWARTGIFNWPEFRTALPFLADVLLVSAVTGVPAVIGLVACRRAEAASILKVARSSSLGPVPKLTG